MSFPTVEHIAAAQTAADRVMAKSGFYCWPSVTLAQALIESAGWTRLAGPNNGFGIKATPAQIASGDCTYVETREVIDGQSRMMKLAFANFASLADAYEAHAMLFVRVGVYAPARHDNNPRQFVVDMARHYATAPNYAKTIIATMDRLNLYQYDRPAHSHSTQTPPLKPAQHDLAKAQAPAAAGAVVAAGGAVAAAEQGGHSALIAALAVAAIAAGVALWRYVQAHAAIADIPATPPAPATIEPPPAVAPSK